MSVNTRVSSTVCMCICTLACGIVIAAPAAETIAVPPPPDATALPVAEPLDAPPSPRGAAVVAVEPVVVSPPPDASDTMEVTVIMTNDFDETNIPPELLAILTNHPPIGSDDMPAITVGSNVIIRIQQPGPGPNIQPPPVDPRGVPVVPAEPVTNPPSLGPDAPPIPPPPGPGPKVRIQQPGPPPDVPPPPPNPAGVPVTQ